MTDAGVRGTMGTAGASSPVIHAQDLEKIYESRDGDSIQALGPLSFDIAPGEFITIVGMSGCGKSTLLKLLAGLIGRTSGTLQVRGNDLNGPQRDIGMVFQDSVLLAWRTVIDNVLLPAEVLGLDRKASRARAIELLETVGLEDFAQKYPRELSGGMQQRVSIARALLHEPKILLMDEPFGALDAMTRESMSLEILRIWEATQKTIVFVTHSITEAVLLANRVIVLSSRPGRIAEIVKIDLPPSRNLNMINSEKFGVYSARIRELLESSTRAQ